MSSSCEREYYPDPDEIYEQRFEYDSYEGEHDPRLYDSCPDAYHVEDYEEDEDDEIPFIEDGDI
jgi:hypothetical protein